IKTDSTLWYSSEADFEYEFIDNGDEARSLIRFTLTLYNQSLEGYIEGCYDVISVDRKADKYIVEYTYGDYYSHDAVKKCEITVGNDGMIISDIME
ncbi:MAG: hypothetical protein SPK79_08530, partial [Erysipelotrichaceae bacterium]|nr:hypothetical protein [Erysipelotrichaceae bacterium]